MIGDAPGPRAKSPWLPRLIAASLCVAAGALLGRMSTKAEPKLWREHGARAVAPSAVPPVLLSFADAVERASPAVACVRSFVPPAAAGASDGEAFGVRNGSGFVIHPTGLVVTARHLTVGSKRIVVELPQFEPFAAELVGEDDVTDIAVLRLCDAPAVLPCVELGPSEILRAGDWIVAVGNSLGFKQSVTAGVVSFVGRHLRHYEVRVSSDFLQFSAPVNPGSSGSPVLDAEGRVVGVTTQAAEAAQGISFAIPSRTLKWVLEAMDKSPDGRVHRGQLGISFDERPGLDADGRPLRGALVQSVVAGGAADAAGIQPGDVVLFVDDHAIDAAGDLHERITRSAPGSQAQLRILRGKYMLEPLAVTLRDAAETRSETAN